MRILGIDAHPDCAYVALWAEGQVQPMPTRIKWPAGEQSQRLLPLCEDVKGVLAQHAIHHVAILLPQRTRRPTGGYFTVIERIALETVIRLAAITLKIPVSMLERATVRARLGLSTTGVLEHYVDQIFPDPAGPYWKAGRGLAAMAAFAAERG